MDLAARNDIVEEDLPQLEPPYEDDTAAFMSSTATSSCLTSVSRNMSGISEAENVVQSKKRLKIDPLWEYFDETEKDRICRICRSSYSEKTGLTTLKDHFEKNHKKVHNELYIQTALPFHVVEPYGKRDQEKTTNITMNLIRWIITDQQPFNVVEDSDFRKFVMSLDKRYRLPSRQFVAETTLKLYEQHKETIHKSLNALPQKFALTTDTWSSCTNLSYLSVTLHWIDNNWKMQRILLDIIPLHERHTGKNLAAAFLETIEYYDIGSRILTVTTDNASNMVVFGSELAKVLAEKYNNYEFTHLRCAAHILNLVVKEGMQRATPSITKIRNFASHIRKSQPAFEELKRIFEMKGKPFLVPDLDVPTRWNSTYHMIMKSCEIREMTDILVASNPKSMKSMYSQPSIQARPWECIRACLNRGMHE